MLNIMPQAWFVEGFVRDLPMILISSFWLRDGGICLRRELTKADANEV